MLSQSRLVISAMRSLHSWSFVIHASLWCPVIVKVNLIFLVNLHIFGLSVLWTFCVWGSSCRLRGEIKPTPKISAWVGSVWLGQSAGFRIALLIQKPKITTSICASMNSARLNLLSPSRLVRPFHRLFQLRILRMGSASHRVLLLC